MPSIWQKLREEEIEKEYKGNELFLEFLCKMLAKQNKMMNFKRFVKTFSQLIFFSFLVFFWFGWLNPLYVLANLFLTNHHEEHVKTSVHLLVLHDAKLMAFLSQQENLSWTQTAVDYSALILPTIIMPRNLGLLLRRSMESSISPGTRRWRSAGSGSSALQNAVSPLQQQFHNILPSWSSKAIHLNRHAIHLYMQMSSPCSLFPHQ